MLAFCWWTTLIFKLKIFKAGSLMYWDEDQWFNYSDHNKNACWIKLCPGAFQQNNLSKNTHDAESPADLLFFLNDTSFVLLNDFQSFLHFGCLAYANFGIRLYFLTTFLFWNSFRFIARLWSWEREFPHTYTVSFVMNIFWVCPWLWYMCHNQWTNIDTVLWTKFHTSLMFT